MKACVFRAFTILTSATTWKKPPLQTYSARDDAPRATAGYTRGACVTVELAARALRSSSQRARHARHACHAFVVASDDPGLGRKTGVPGIWKKLQRLHDSHPWLQVDAHAGQVHVEQPQLSHLAAQLQEPEAQPQVEEQEQAMLGFV